MRRPHDRTGATQRKDWWDKAAVVATIVGASAVPAILLVGGYLLDRNLKERTTDIQAKVADIQAKVAEQTAGYQASDLQLKRGALVRDLLPVLTAAAPKDRVRGYHIAMWALPTEAPTLLSNLYDMEVDESVRQQVNPLFRQIGIIKAVVVASEAITSKSVEIVKRSGPKDSGPGSTFSEQYELCSDPLPADAIVQRHEMQLVGDRSCNAWATCTLASADSRICYRFSLQGHNEFPAFLQNGGVRKSEAILRVTYTQK